MIKKEHDKNKSEGITLIVLVVTIIVLLILAGISVSMITGDNGIINKAGFAKEQTEVAKEKESIGTAAVHAINKSKFGDITQLNLQQQINNEFGEEKKAKVYEEDESFLVLVENRLYKVDKDGNVELSEENFELPKREFATQLSNNELGASDDKPYEIKCIEDLLDFSLTVNGIVIENNEITYSTKYNNFNKKYVSLVKNLDFKLPLSYENAERTDYGDINQDGKVENLLKELTTGKGWICIGGYGNTKNGTGFSGTFEGNDNRISNLYINDEEETSCSGFFGYANVSILKDINIFANIYCKSSYASGICGRAAKEIKKCTFSGILENSKESSYTGGIIALGHPSGCNIEECNCKGRIKGTTYVGGIVGSYATKVDNSYNESNVIGDRLIGGISGGGGQILNSYNTGKIEGNNAIAGIVGYRGSAEKCHNIGTIICKSGSGGIIGSEATNITECYNKGEIKGTGDNIGGIAGTWFYSDGHNIINCYNIGKVYGTSGVSGILGVCDGGKKNSTIEKCYNLGEIQGTTYVGGILGKQGTGSNNLIVNCYNINKVTATNTSGYVSGIGLAWQTANIRIVNCYNIGEIIGPKKYGIGNCNIIKNSYYLSTCGATDSNGTSISSNELKNLAPTLDKAYTIDEETGEITISETEIQNVWKADTNNKNQGYPIFDWQ